jgi:hypothetical protein
MLATEAENLLDEFDDLYNLIHADVRFLGGVDSSCLGHIKPDLDNINIKYSTLPRQDVDALKDLIRATEAVKRRVGKVVGSHRTPPHVYYFSDISHTILFACFSPYFFSSCFSSCFS